MMITTVQPSVMHNMKLKTVTSRILVLRMHKKKIKLNIFILNYLKDPVKNRSLVLSYFRSNYGVKKVTMNRIFVLCMSYAYALLVREFKEGRNCKVMCDIT